MDLKEKIHEVINEFAEYLNIEFNQKKSINVSLECAQKWEKFDAYLFSKKVKHFCSETAIQKNVVPQKEVQSVPQRETERQGNESEESEITLEDIQSKLKLIEEEVRNCTKCPLHLERTQTVFGTGNPRAELVFVGEAPGAEEDRQGLPFVGRAGQLLTDIIVKGMKMRREDVYICNVLKCRPPENRDPNPMEVFHCEPYLLEQLRLIRPKVICALGRISAQTLLKTNASTNELRGKWHDYHGIPLRVTYHPAYLLRNPKDKAKTWADIQEIMKFLNGEIMIELNKPQSDLL